LFGKEEKTMLLGDLAKKAQEISKERPDAAFYVDTPLGWYDAYGLASYRGYYEQLALVIGDDRGAGMQHAWTITQFADELESSIGKVYTGYKGGEYKMHKDTYIWVVTGRSRTSDLVVGEFEPLHEDCSIVLKTIPAPR
jgi:hypothetical protein